MICRGHPFKTAAGTEIFAGNLATVLAQKGNFVSMVYGGNSQSIPRQINLHTEPISLVPIPYIRAIDFARTCATRCLRLIREFDLDLVLAFGAGTFGGHVFHKLRKSSRNYKLVYYAMDTMLRESRRTNDNWRPFISLKGVTSKLWYAGLIASDVKSCKESDMVLASSKDTAEWLVKDYGISAEKVRVLYEGIPDDYEKGVQSHVPQIPTFLHISGGPRKGTGVFLEALKILSAKLGTRSRAIITRLGSADKNPVEKHGFELHTYREVPVDFLKRLYASTTALVAPSFSEGFCLPVLEAAAFGKPTLASNAGSLRELVNHGKDGFIVPAGDVETLASRMYQLANSPELLVEMSFACREKASRFRISRVAMELADLATSLQLR